MAQPWDLAIGSRFRPGRLLLGMSFCLALLALLVAGCSFFSPPPDPYVDLRASWSPGFSLSEAELAALPSYSITVRIDPRAKPQQYTGTLDLMLPVTGQVPLHELYFRTYPNLYAFGGNLRVTGARVDGITVNFGSAAEGTAVLLDLVKPLRPGQRAHIWLSFAGEIARESQPGQYTIFGYNENVLSLTNFYPILAARRGDAWALEIPHPQGDVGFHDAALYRVEITFPADQILIAPGTEVTRTVSAEGWALARYVLGPAREFTVLLGERYQVLSAEASGVRVRSFFKPEDADAGKSALYHAIAALQIYSDTFGLYPYREMMVVEAPLLYHGMEFPGLSLIGSQVYNRFIKDLETLVAHEVAHQWWYNQVGNDQVLTPWLDEGLTEFSMYVYYCGRYGEPAAERLRQLRWEIPVASVAAQGGDLTIGRPVRNYKEHYETLVYGRGALFFATLRDELGPAKFETLLRTYLDRYRWQIATPAAFQALAEEVAGRDLDTLFNEWVYGK
ncbi:MAG: M1 family metallopeptidase [Anaerolineae bacterium]